MLKEGDKVPSFSLESDSGERVSLGDFDGKTLVLFFYPKDSTPGCTREAQAFTAARRAFEKAGAAVVGVSPDSVKSHGSFRDKYSLDIPLLSDPDRQLHEAFGAWGEKTVYGKKILGAIRSTFVIQNRRVVRVFPTVKVDGHADKVLEAIAELSGGKSASAAPKKTPASATVTKATASKKAAAPKAMSKATPKKTPAKKKTRA